MKLAITAGLISPLLLVTLIAPANGYSPKHHVSATCGTERKSFKLLTDRQGTRIANEKPVPTTLATLVSMTTPADPDTLRYRWAPLETHVWSTVVALLGYTLEADGDFHLVIAMPNDNTITAVAEIPAPACAERNLLRTRLASARRSVEAIGHRAPRRERFIWLDRYGPPPLVRIIGVGFADRIHRVRGMAPNGAELHPVLSVTLLSTQP